MLRIEKTQIALYVWYAIVLLLSIFGHQDMGLFAGCSIWQRASYPLFHQNIFHAMVNLLAFHQCIRYVPCRWFLLVFYAVAVSYPFATAVPVVGLSGVVYAYMGYIAPHVQKKVRYNVTILIYIVIGLFLPNIAIGVHIYCYVLGLLWGYLNAPLCQDK